MLHLILISWISYLVEWIHHSAGHQMRKIGDIMNSSLFLTPDSQFIAKSCWFSYPKSPKSTTFHPNSGFHYFFKNLEYYQSLLIGLFSSLIFLQSSSFCQSDLKNKDRSCLLTKIFSFPLPLRIQFELFGLTPFCPQYWAQVLVVPASAIILAMLSPHLPPKPFKTQRRCDLQEALCDAHSPQVKCPSAVLL